MAGETTKGGGGKEGKVEEDEEDEEDEEEEGGAKARVREGGGPVMAWTTEGGSTAKVAERARG